MKHCRSRCSTSLNWEAGVSTAHIGVTANDVVVTLSGQVETYAAKLQAERAATRVTGVKTVVEHIEVKLADQNRETDDLIAERVMQKLEWDITLPADGVKAKDENGWVTLSDKVTCYYQKTAAFYDVHNLSGVVGVMNLITVEPLVKADNVRNKIVDSLKRNAEIDANHISIKVGGGKVVLGGNVHSYRELILARRAGWSAPGVFEVVDHIKII
jgi:osmotically-inducible protein OsmY